MLPDYGASYHLDLQNCTPLYLYIYLFSFSAQNAVLLRAANILHRKSRRRTARHARRVEQNKLPAYEGAILAREKLCVLPPSSAGRSNTCAANSAPELLRLHAAQVNNSARQATWSWPAPSRVPTPLTHTHTRTHFLSVVSRSG